MSGPLERVLRNAAWLFGGQVLGAPLSLVVNAVMSRSLGAAAFGELYLCSTLAGFGFLLVDFGQSTVLAGEIAKQRERANELLASAFAWRGAAAVLVSLSSVVGAYAFGFSPPLLAVLCLVLAAFSANSLAGVGQDGIRGLERTDFAAISGVALQLLSVAVTIPILLGGGSLRTMLAAQLACALLGVVVVLIAVARFGLRPRGLNPRSTRLLLSKGWPLVVFSLVLALQPNIDALFLQRYGSEAALGWHAAARKLIGVLAAPANTLIVAMYPTLSRLYVEDRDAYARLGANALGSATLIAVPAALGCFLFPELGISIFSKSSFAPAEDNLRILAGYLALLYFSMPLSSCLVAADKQRQWSLVQLACVVVSALGDGPLVRWFQAQRGNGGLGVCLTSLISEALMVCGGLYLIPRGIVTREWLARIARALVAGAAMWLSARALRGFNAWLVAPIASVAYVVCLIAIGGTDAAQRAAVLQRVRRLVPQLR